VSVEDAQEAVNEAQKPIKTWPGPTTPVTENLIEGKKVGIVACGPPINCQRQAKGAAAAVRALGGEPLVYTPTELTPAEINSAMLNFINNEGVAVLLNGGWPPAIIGPSLEAAEAKGVPVIILRSGQPNENEIEFPGGGEPPEEVQGKILADYLIAESEGTAKVIAIDVTEFPASQMIIDGFRKELEGCGGCELIDTLGVTFSEFATGIPQKVVSALQQNPDAEYIFAPFDGMAQLAIGGINQAGRRGEVQAVATGGEPASLESIEDDGGQIATVAQPQEWQGWAMVDQALRVLAQEERVDHPFPLRLFDAQNIKNPNKLWKGDVNFRQQFRELWGLES
jgi:ABC-type sugar transport system substrate-binding protein